MTVIADVGDKYGALAEGHKKGKLKYSEKRLPSLPLCAQKFPNGPDWDRKRNSADKGRRVRA